MLKATRDGFGEAILLATKENPNLLVLSADSVESLRLTALKEERPNQYLELGVSEQNMAGVAAGLAMLGKTVVIAGFATFNPGRNWEQIRVAICEQNLPVKIVGSHAGLATGADGATHQALEDLALMTVLPNMKVVVPADFQEAKDSTLALLKEPGPGYLRLSREPTENLNLSQPFIFGKAQLLHSGDEATIVACGLMVSLALQVAIELEAFNLQIRVLNMSTVKPLDKAALLQAAQETKAIVVAEEHQENGGLGSLIATYLSQVCPTNLALVAVADAFGQSGTKAELFQHYHLTSKKIKEKILTLIQKKYSIET